MHHPIIIRRAGNGTYDLFRRDGLWLATEQNRADAVDAAARMLLAVRTLWQDA